MNTDTEIDFKNCTVDDIPKDDKFWENLGWWMLGGKDDPKQSQPENLLDLIEQEE